jgi:light-harvesting complex II chlorophyll a/b binding protein 2
VTRVKKTRIRIWQI